MAQSNPNAGSSNNASTFEVELKVNISLELDGQKCYEILTLGNNASWAECKKLLDEAVALYGADKNLRLTTSTGGGWVYWELDPRGGIISEKLRLDQGTFPTMMKFLQQPRARVLLDHCEMHREMRKLKAAYRRAQNWMADCQLKPDHARFAPVAQEDKDALEYLQWQIRHGFPDPVEVDESWP